MHQRSRPPGRRADHGKQLPFWQNWFGAHCVPHMPQLFASNIVFVHVPLQLVRLPGQLHCPWTHVEPTPHALPHMPQCVLLIWRFTHEPSHSVNPA